MSSTNPVKNVGAYFNIGSLSRFIPEPKSRVGNTFQSVASTIGSFVGRALSATSGSTSTALNPEYQDLINTQIEVQQQMQLVSLQSNIEKSRHETSMAPIRNIRVG